VIGRIDDADRHFEKAWRLEDAMRFPALAARSRYWHARLLAQSQDSDKCDRGVALLQNAQAVTLRLGMAHLHRQTTTLIESIEKHRQAKSKAWPPED
jgi:hypothetical protein